MINKVVWNIGIITLLGLIGCFSGCSKKVTWTHARALDGACFMDDSTILITAWEFDVGRSGGGGNAFPVKEEEEIKNYTYNIYKYSLLTQNLETIYSKEGNFTWEGSGTGRSGKIFFRSPMLYYSIFDNDENDYNIEAYNIQTNEVKTIVKQAHVSWVSESDSYHIISLKDDSKKVLDKKNNNTITPLASPFYIDESKGDMYGTLSGVNAIARINLDDTTSIDTVRYWNSEYDTYLYVGTQHIIRWVENKAMVIGAISDFINGIYKGNNLADNLLPHSIYDLQKDTFSYLYMKSGLFYGEWLRDHNENVLIMDKYAEE